MSEARIQRSTGEGFITVEIDYDKWPGARALGWSCTVSLIHAMAKWETFLDVTCEGDDPAAWLVSDAQTTYDAGRTDQRAAQRLLSERFVTIATMPESGAILRLSELPDVLEVVQAAWEAAKASERLTMAEEIVSELRLSRPWDGS